MGLVAFAGTLIAQNPGAPEHLGRKAKIHHAKVYTIADEAARVLKDAEEQAYEVTDHAGTIQTANGISEGSQAFYSRELGAIREDLNAIGKSMARLEALQENEKTWERRTVTRTMPLLKQVVATTEEAIRFLNDRPGRVAFSDHQKLTTKLYDQSTVLWKTLHESVRLAELRQREIRLRKDAETINKPTD